MAEKVKDDKYLMGELENKVFIKMVGNSTMKNSKTFESILSRIFSGEEKDIILDMEECNYMDSTVLGLIAKNAIKMKKLWGKKMYAINVPNIILSGLKSTGIDKILEIVAGAKKTNVEVKKIDTQDFIDKTEKTAHILDAHKTLMELNENNEKTFKNVVNLLEKELNL